MTTPFQEEVYRLVSMIPEGYVTTYGLISSFISVSQKNFSKINIYSRAVGNALAVNPYAPDVPCHRVIRSDLTIGGFRGDTGITQQRKKLKLLLSEGVEFDHHMKLKNRSRLWKFEV